MRNPRTPLRRRPVRRTLQRAGRRLRPRQHRASTCGLATLVIAAAVGLTACGNAPLTPYAAKPMALHALTGVAITADGAQLTLPMTDASATGSIVTTAEAGCTAALSVTTAAKDGTCAMSLRFVPRSDGPGLGLAEASLVARDSVGTCAPLAARLPPGAADVVYSLSAGAAWLPWVEPKPVEVTDGRVAIDKVLIDLRGEITLATGGAAGDSIQLADHSVRIGGDLVLEVNDTATCVPCADEVCESPYPQLRLRDAQPKSVAYNLEYALDRWLGQYLVVILTQGW